MYVAYTAAHWPMHALPEDIARYEGKYDARYEPIRQARFKKVASLGLIDSHQPMTPTVQNWNKVADKEWEAAGMEVYAAMIDRMDQGVGKLVAELKRTGRFENTLILYLQDNGGCAEVTGSTPRGEIKERPARPTLEPIGNSFAIAEDGMVVDLEAGKAAIVGKVDAGYIFVDGTTIGDISEMSLTDRRILGEEVVDALVLDPDRVEHPRRRLAHARGRLALPRDERHRLHDDPAGSRYVEERGRLSSGALASFEVAKISPP